MKMTPYDILGVSEHSSEKEIKARYRTLVRLYHPDRFQSDPEGAKLASEKMSEVNLAYEEILEAERSRKEKEEAERKRREQDAERIQKEQEAERERKKRDEAERIRKEQEAERIRQEQERRVYEEWFRQEQERKAYHARMIKLSSKRRVIGLVILLICIILLAIVVSFIFILKFMPDSIGAHYIEDLIGMLRSR